MAVSSVERILDLGVTDLNDAACSILHFGPPHDVPDIEPKSTRLKQYKDGGHTLRWYLGLMGETSPALSPLSVDVAGDKEYRVYRYDWAFGIGLPNVNAPAPEAGAL